MRTYASGHRGFRRFGRWTHRRHRIVELHDKSYDGYDFIVVGAGSAGCAVAGRLATESSANVLLVEAGGSDRRLAIARRWPHPSGSTGHRWTGRMRPNVSQAVPTGGSHSRAGACSAAAVR